MTSEELHWLAGFIEGEGSLMPGPPSSPRSIRLFVGCCDHDVVRRAADLMGVNKLRERIDFKPDHRVFGVLLEKPNLVRVILKLSKLIIIRV